MIEPRAHLKDIVRSGKESLIDALRLHRNERAEPFAKEVFEKIIATFDPEDLCFYPDEGALLKRLTRDLSVEPDMLSISSGSDAAIRHTFQAFVAPDDLIIYCNPSYAMYGVYAELFQARTSVLEYGPDRIMPVESYLAALAKNPRLLIITNPDQPTGASLSSTELDTIILTAAERGVLVLVDEAYFPFCSVTSAPLVRQYANLIVTRTFSKIFGLAGVRVGFALGNRDLIVSLDSVKGASEVNALGLKAACWLIDNTDVVKAHHADLERGRQILLGFAAQRGWNTPPCPVNFQLIQPPEGVDPQSIVQGLAARKIAVKGGFQHPSVTGYIRITLCGEAMMEHVVAALGEIHQ